MQRSNYLRIMEKGIIFARDTIINGPEKNFRFKGCEFGRNILIEAGAIFNVIGGFIGDRTIIRSGARVEGNSVVLGRESYLDHGAWIGGGSCFDEGAFLNAGDWLHMGWNSQINIARGVEIGHECGVGIETKILTHGSYPPVDFGFPVQWGKVKIGNRVWLPNAWVNPGVTIEDNVVVAAMSLVNRDLPAGCLAGGIPVKVLRENAYPKFDRTAIDRMGIKGIDIKHLPGTDIITCGETEFDIFERKIEGPVTPDTERVKNQLRRNGIRFPFTPKGGVYVHWDNAYS